MRPVSGEKGCEDDPIPMTQSMLQKFTSPFIERDKFLLRLNRS